MRNASTTVRIFAIVPAAGRSERMGRAKQLLDVGGRPMLLAVLEPLLASDVAGVVLVTQRVIAEQLGLSREGKGGLPFQRRVRDSDAGKLVVAYNDNESAEMIDSIRIGLRTWRERTLIADRDGFLVCPADQPGIATADFNACIAAFRAAPDRIVIAARAGRRGHPLVFAAALAAFVESAACDGGLHALPHAHADRVTLVECSSPGVTRDVDTPADWGERPR